MPHKARTMVGIEVGGTFTDLVAFEGDTLLVEKVNSVPSEPEVGAFNALKASEIALGQVEDLVHGSTVATNAVLERNGGPIAFVTTEGFRDLLFLQRHDRRRIYDLNYHRPEALVRRRDCFGVRERILSDGKVAVALDVDAETDRLVALLAAGRYNAVAICLLNSYADPRHERALAERLRHRLSHLLVTPSFEVVPEFREYERASTTAFAAYVQPVIDRYLKRFEARLAEQRFAGRFTVMQSNGGRLPAAAMRKNAITSLYSGPAAGVVGAVRQVGRSGFRNLITLDIGGTSTDVSLVENGRPTLASETEVDGLPIRTPVLDIVTVGSGGGSIIWIDDGDMLRVGPASAGSNPGPACYGLGGRVATLTDAHLVRGTLQADTFLGGRMRLHENAAKDALDAVGRRLGQTPVEIADSALKLANASIVRAIQLVSTERGRDPREFVMVPFGGAGPLHAAEIAGDLGIDTIVVPPNPGVMSAYGLLAADLTRYASQSRLIDGNDAAPSFVEETFKTLSRELANSFKAVGLDTPPEFTLTAEMRFKGQAYEVPVDFDPARLARMSGIEFEASFLNAYRCIYMHAVPAGRPFEVVSLRVGARISTQSVPALCEAAARVGSPTRRAIFADGRMQDALFLSVGAVTSGGTIDGPAVLQSQTSSIFIPAGWRASRDADDNILMRAAS